jgi:hypothetical protein
MMPSASRSAAINACAFDAALAAMRGIHRKIDRIAREEHRLGALRLAAGERVAEQAFARSARRGVAAERDDARTMRGDGTIEHGSSFS